MAQIIDTLTTYLFQYVVVWMLLGAGLFLSVRYRFVQFRRLPEAFRAMVAQQSAAAGGVLTPFQAFMTALGASIGTGNIAGVATAIISGGPGRAVLDLDVRPGRHSVKFTEAVLAVRYRRRAGRHGAGRTDVRPARRMKSPGLAKDLRARRRRRRADDDALHPAELDRARARQRVRRADVDRRPRHRRAGVGGDHPRHQVDRGGWRSTCCR